MSILKMKKKMLLQLANRISHCNAVRFLVKEGLPCKFRFTKLTWMPRFPRAQPHWDGQGTCVSVGGSNGKKGRDGHDFLISLLAKRRCSIGLTSQLLVEIDGFSTTMINGDAALSDVFALTGIHIYRCRLTRTIVLKYDTRKLVYPCQEESTVATSML